MYGEKVYRFVVGIVREIDTLEDTHLEEWIILKRIFRKWNGFMYWIEFVRSRTGVGNL